MEKKRAELVRRLKVMLEDQANFPDGKLPPERELAATLSVGRNLLREAMVSLEAMGLLEIRERQGAFVQRPSMEDFSASLKYAALWPEDMLVYLMEMRLVIETPIASLAAERRTESELEKMEECVRMLEAAQGNPDGGASSGSQWDSMLHKLIVEAAHNPLLARLYEGLSATMERYIDMSRTRLLAIEGWPVKILREHRELVASIAQKDSEAAGEAQRRHLESALSRIKALSAS